MTIPISCAAPDARSADFLPARMISGLVIFHSHAAQRARCSGVEQSPSPAAAWRCEGERLPESLREARKWSRVKRQGGAHIHNGRVRVRSCVKGRRDGGRGRRRSAALTMVSTHRPAYDTGEGAAAAHGEDGVGQSKRIRRGDCPCELGRREGCRWWWWCRLRMLFWALITPGRPLSARDMKQALPSLIGSLGSVPGPSPVPAICPFHVVWTGELIHYPLFTLMRWMPFARCSCSGARHEPSTRLLRQRQDVRVA
jgi:hypothetical protein